MIEERRVRVQVADRQAPDGEGEQEPGTEARHHRHHAAPRAEVGADQNSDEQKDDRGRDRQIGQDRVVLFDEVWYLAVVGDAQAGRELRPYLCDLALHRGKQVRRRLKVDLGALQVDERDHRLPIGRLQEAAREAIEGPRLGIELLLEPGPRFFRRLALFHVDIEGVGVGLGLIDHLIELAHQLLEPVLAKQQRRVILDPLTLAADVAHNRARLGHVALAQPLGEQRDEAAVGLGVGRLRDDRQVRLAAEQPVELGQRLDARRFLGQKLGQPGLHVAEKLHRKDRRRNQEQEQDDRGPARRRRDLFNQLAVELPDGARRAGGPGLIFCL